MQRFEKCPKPQRVAFLNLVEQTVSQSEPYTYYGGLDQNRRSRYTIPTSNVVFYKSDDNLIDTAADVTHI